MGKSISIIIPAYNEESRIEKTLAEIENYCKKNLKSYEIIVVDDASTDNTYKIASRHKNKNLRVIKNQINSGKGYSVKRGILESKSNLILFSDADLSTPINELDRFLYYIGNGFDIVIASRNLKESKKVIKQPWYRDVMGKIFPMLVDIFIIKDFKDTQCGFKLFKADVAKKIAKVQTLERFAFDVEMLFIAKKMKCRIKEAPVTWVGRKESKLYPLKDPIRMLGDIIKIKVNDLKGKYSVN